MQRRWIELDGLANLRDVGGIPTADGGILFNYEQCFECGTCYLVCNKEGAISWSYLSLM